MYGSKLKFLQSFIYSIFYDAQPSIICYAKHSHSRALPKWSTLNPVSLTHGSSIWHVIVDFCSSSVGECINLFFTFCLTFVQKLVSLLLYSWWHPPFSRLIHPHTQVVHTVVWPSIRGFVFGGHVCAVMLFSRRSVLVIVSIWKLM